MGEPYTPFGKEWEKAIMKMTKTDIIRLFKKVAKEKLELERILKNQVNVK